MFEQRFAAMRPSEGGMKAVAKWSHQHLFLCHPKNSDLTKTKHKILKLEGMQTGFRFSPLRRPT